MPLGKGIRFRVKQTKKGPVRLAIRGGSAKKKTGTIVEAKNLRSGATHTASEFQRDRARRTALARKR